MPCDNCSNTEQATEGFCCNDCLNTFEQQTAVNTNLSSTPLDINDIPLLALNDNILQCDGNDTFEFDDLSDDSSSQDNLSGISLPQTSDQFSALLSYTLQMPGHFFLNIMT